MARSFAQLRVAIWDNEDFLARSPAAQRMYMLLLSQKKLTMVGVLPFTPRRWARLSRTTTVADVEEAITELVTHRFVVVDEDTDELLVRTIVKHDPPHSYKSIIAMWRAWEAVESATLRSVIVEHLPAKVLDSTLAPPPAEAKALVERPSHRASDELPDRASQGCSERASDGEPEATSDARVGADARPAFQPSNDPPATKPLAQPVPKPPSVAVELVEPAAPAREPNPLFDALVEACGWRYLDMPKRQRSATGVAASELKRLGVEPAEIRRRAVLFREHYPTATLTPSGLVNQWAACAEPPRRANGSPVLSRSEQALANNIARAKGLQQ